MKTRIVSEILSDSANYHKNRTFRYNPVWAYKRKDNNIFSFASTLFTLKTLKAGLNPELQERINLIDQQIRAYYPEYQNKDGRDTYNFYKTKPSQHFPNGYFMRYFDHFRLPDDIDDTALISYTLDLPKEKIEKLKILTESFAEISPDGRQVYNTWYGKNMPKEQDVCAILNLLYLFQSYHLPLSKTDTDSIRYLEEKIGLIETKPFEIARHYAHPALILYHYARFMSAFPQILRNKETTIKDIIYRVLEKEKVTMNRLILESSLIRMGENRPSLDLTDMNFKDFYTFIGAPLAPFSNLLAKKLAGKPAFQMFWSSEIHNKALVLEYLVLSERL